MTAVTSAAHQVTWVQVPLGRGGASFASGTEAEEV